VDTLVLDDSYHIVTIDRQRSLVVDRSAAFARWIARLAGNEPGQVEILRQRAVMRGIAD
jgi:carboxylesterase